MTRALADAGVNLRGISAAAMGNRMVCHLALDAPEDASKAVEVLEKLG